jgi:hypothetical protein
LLRSPKRPETTDAQSSFFVVFISGLCPKFLETVVTREIEASADPATLFRGNTLATKSVDHYMRLVGTPVCYLHPRVKSAPLCDGGKWPPDASPAPSQMLHMTLASTLSDILSRDVKLEVNPSSTNDEKLLEASARELQYLVS